jgi:hypothetical protein
VTGVQTCALPIWTGVSINTTETANDDGDRTSWSPNPNPNPIPRFRGKESPVGAFTANVYSACGGGSKTRMRLTVREAPAHVTAPTHRSIVRSPVGAVPIAVLLAFASVDEPPIAYLAVAPHAAQLASSSSSSPTIDNDDPRFHLP